MPLTCPECGEAAESDLLLRIHVLTEHQRILPQPPKTASASESSTKAVKQEEPDEPASDSPTFPPVLLKSEPPDPLEPPDKTEKPPTRKVTPTEPAKKTEKPPPRAQPPKPTTSEPPPQAKSPPAPKLAFPLFGKRSLRLVPCQTLLGTQPKAKRAKTSAQDLWKASEWEEESPPEPKKLKLSHPPPRPTEETTPESPKTEPPEPQPAAFSAPPLACLEAAAPRCSHNAEPCTAFPGCLGRNCPLLHPDCPAGEDKVLCVLESRCPFEHRRYEKSCWACEERSHPTSLPPLAIRCPHRARRCESQLHSHHARAPDAARCRFANRCLNSHGLCTEEPLCRKGASCYFEHSYMDSVVYFCEHCEHYAQRHPPGPRRKAAGSRSSRDRDRGRQADADGLRMERDAERCQETIVCRAVVGEGRPGPRQRYAGTFQRVFHSSVPEQLPRGPRLESARTKTASREDDASVKSPEKGSRRGVFPLPSTKAEPEGEEPRPAPEAAKAPGDGCPQATTPSDRPGPSHASSPAKPKASPGGGGQRAPAKPAQLEPSPAAEAPAEKAPPPRGRLGVWAEPAPRCAHNAEACKAFPFCAGRNCPRRHPPCTTAPQREMGCLAKKACAFEHWFYEKACDRCPGRRPQASLEPLVRVCAHWKNAPCHYFPSACSKPASKCMYRHGQCSSDCGDGRRCSREHLDGLYFCVACQKIRVS